MLFGIFQQMMSYGRVRSMSVFKLNKVTESVHGIVFMVSL